MKKGYFFMLDAFIATSIIIFSLVLIFSFSSSRPYQMQGLFLAQDAMDIFTKTKVNELNNQFVLNLTAEGNITNTENTLIEQTAEFYILNKTQLAESFLVNVTIALVPSKYGFEVSIYNSTSRFSYIINQGTTNQSEAYLVLVSKEIISGMLEDYTLWGPMTAEVKIWQ